jgi:F-type H+-transporting ATPase subunit gamma
MSGGMREIKRRIKSVGSTRQITKAMNLVASSKLNKSKDRFLQVRPFFEMTQGVIAKVASGAGNMQHPYITSREVKKATVIVLAGDRGLCGGYNVNVCQSAVATCPDTPCDYVTVGAKSYEYLKARGKNISLSVRGISENPTYDDARSIGEEVLRRYAAGETDAVYLAYTKYLSTISYESTCIRLLPFDLEEFKGDGEADNGLTLYEPSAGEVLSYVLPKYINTVIYGAMAESALCEQSARMTAMDSATENANEMIDTLNIKYNRARQGAITQEITEIIGGADL